MHDIDRGFRIGDRHFAWGITADEAADALHIPRDEGRGSRWRRIEVACRPTWELETISAELTAHGADRPVTALKYELMAVDGDIRPDPARWAEPIAAMLGEPATSGYHELPASGDPSGSVRFYASWPAGSQSVGLSLYGAPRKVDHGLAAGCLWLNWSTEAAARPFLAEWQGRARALVTEAACHSGIVTFVLSEPHVGGLARQNDKDRDSVYALDAPQLLPTPPSIASQLGKRGIGFWRSGDQRRWYASNGIDTIAFDMGRPVEIDVYDVKPAKGGGYIEIAVDGWSVRDIYGSRAVDDAVEALRTIPGVRIRKVDGHDC